MVTLFDKFRVFENKYGELEIASRNEMIMTNKDTGKEQKCSIDDFCKLIKTVFPDREVQKELLQQIFKD